MNWVRDHFYNEDFTNVRFKNFIDNIQDEVTKDIYWNLSGTTLWACYIKDNKLKCVNLGDSRAVIYSYTKDHKWSAIQLSKDHKLDLDEERKRIEDSNGRVHQFINSEGQPFGPQRVFKIDENIPGLAMSRSLGDTIAHSIGVASTPGNNTLFNIV